MEVENDTNDDVVYTVKMGGPPFHGDFMSSLWVFLRKLASLTLTEARGTFRGRHRRVHPLHPALQYRVTFTVTTTGRQGRRAKGGIAYDRRVILRRNSTTGAYFIDVEAPRP